MRVLVTGSHGTIGSTLIKILNKSGHIAVGWDRGKARIDNYNEMENYVRELSPDIIFHLAIASQPTGMNNESWNVNYHWTSELAWITKLLKIKLVYTSTVMVFSNDNPGPYTVASKPDAQYGYGYEKRMAEQRVFYQNPDAYIVRLGWQIGEKPGSNNMIDYFSSRMKEEGVIKASRKWLPACSFVEVTAKKLIEIPVSFGPGLFLIDSNTRWNFFEIASALNDLHGNHWIIEPNDDFVYDQRMIDERIKMPPLSSWLRKLK